MIGRLKLVWVLVCIFVATLALAPLQFVALRTNRGLARILPRLWHAFACWLIDLRVHQQQELSDKRPLLIVANHVSWLDIVVLSRIHPVSFIAKHEVNTIPGVSLLARLQGTVFVNRDQRRQAETQADEISRRLIAGDVMVLFPEGTTGDGNRLLPFKSALFGASNRAVRSGQVTEAFVQPVAIRFMRRNGLPLGRAGRARVAWPGDLELAPHFSDVVRGGPLDVAVSFAEPVRVIESTRRQELAATTRDRIRSMLADRLHVPYMEE